MRLIRHADLVPMPWKNGGGQTCEIAVFPPAAGFDDFDWRISMADVASDGAFSTFPGIDRCLFILQGAGIDLSVGSATYRLCQGERIDFRGDDPASARLLAGSVVDLNIMTRRGRCRPWVQARRIEGPSLELPQLGLPGPPTALFVRAGQVTVDGIACERWDTLIWDHAAGGDTPAARIMTDTVDVVLFGLG